MDPISKVHEAASIGSGESHSQSQIIQPGDPLYEAAAWDNLEPFEGKDPHDLLQIVTHFKDTILHIHIKLKRISGPRSPAFVEKILDKCPSLLFQINMVGDTPLHVAAKGGRSDIVGVLIQRARRQPKEPESMLRMKNNQHNTALHEAVMHHELQVVEILSKADPDFPSFANKYGETPLYHAVTKGDLNLARAILDGCKLAADEGPNGKTALHAAVWAIDKRITKFLLEKKNLTRITDQYGWTPLHYAAYNGKTSIAKMLLEEDRYAACIGDEERQMTPLHMAVSQGESDIAKEIIRQCPESCEIVDNRGWNFLHFAVLTFNREELDDLLKYPSVDSIVNEKDVNGNTPFHVSAAAYRLNSLSIGTNIIAVNHRNVSVMSILVSGHLDLEEEIQDLIEDVGKGRQYHGGVICKRNEKNYYKNEVAQIKKYEAGLLKTTKSNSVVATLIATVTFSAVYSVPGDYNSEENDIHEGTAILIRNSAFQAFIITDTIAFILSLAAVFIHFIMSFEKTVQHGNLILVEYERLSKLASCFTMLAIVGVVVAFVTGLYAVLEPSLWLAIATCCIGLSFFLLVFDSLKLFWSYFLQWRQRGKKTIKNMLEETYGQNMVSRIYSFLED